MIGFSIAPIGNGVLIGTDGQIKIATTAGGAYSSYGDPLPAGFSPSAIWWPRYQFGSTSASNSGATPQYLIASDTEDGSGNTVYKVTASGVTFTDITPSVGGFTGLAVSPDCIAMPFKSGSRIAAVLLFDTEVHIVTSVNAGSAWTDRGQVDDSALYIRYRRGDLTLNQLLLANGITDFTVSPTHGSNLISKSSPTTSALIGAEFYG